MHAFRSLSVAAVTCSIIALMGCTEGPSTETLSSTPVEQVGSHAHGGEGKININTAILSELDKLEAQLGIPELSDKIQSNRPYASPEELVSKKVISQEEYGRIQEMVTTEEIVLTGEAKDIDYLVKLGLMKGHLKVAKELLEMGNAEAAEPHIGHPVEEIYVDVEDQLQERGVPAFKETLIRLQDLVKSKPNDPQIQVEFDKTVVAIDGAIATLPEAQRQSPAFVLQVIDGLLNTASAEYTAAIANGKITEAIEYQDSRGFVDYAANGLYPTIEAKLTENNPQVNQQIKGSLAELQKAWPSVMPPEMPVMSADEVAAKVQENRKNMQAIVAANTQ